MARYNAHTVRLRALSEEKSPPELWEDARCRCPSCFAVHPVAGSICSAWRRPRRSRLQNVCAPPFPDGSSSRFQWASFSCSSSERPDYLSSWALVCSPGTSTMSWSFCSGSQHRLRVSAGWGTVGVGRSGRRGLGARVKSRIHCYALFVYINSALINSDGLNPCS